MSDRERLLPVDAVRGIAMLFIGVSHISFYLINDSARLVTELRAIGFVATPVFLLMSGLACGYQLAAAPTAATAWRIVDRGLFTFLIGHLLVAGSLVYVVPPGTAFEHVVITDSIGVLLCLAPLLKRATAARLLWSGAAIYTLCSTIGLFWQPLSGQQALFGALLLSIKDGSIPDVGWVTPTLPYLGIFLFGVGLGKLISQCRRNGSAHQLSVRLAAGGTAAIAAAVAINVARHFLKPWLMAHWVQRNWADVLLTTMNVRHDSPPTLGYALFYGGIGIALVGYLGLLPQRELAESSWRALRPRGLVEHVAVIGRASFVAYVVQQWLIDFVPLWVGFDSWLTPVTAPAYLLLASAVMYAAASVWGRYRANRFMTLGLDVNWSSAIAVFTCLVAVAVGMNALALENASRLTPPKLALVPVNSHPWKPTRLAVH
jgi:uncharacterized membrane protein